MKPWDLLKLCLLFKIIIIIFILIMKFTSVLSFVLHYVSAINLYVNKTM